MELTQSGREKSMEAALTDSITGCAETPAPDPLMWGRSNPVLPLLLDTCHHKEPSASRRFLSHFPTALGTVGILRLQSHDEH